MKLKQGVIFLFLITIFVTSCDKDKLIVEGMAPVYISATDFTVVKSLPPQAFENLGKIVNVGNYIFINEKEKGIHVIENSDPSNPQNIRFLNIPGNLEFTIKGNILYADNSIHLLVIDISNINKIVVLNYIENLYIDDPVRHPRPEEGYVGYFECVDKNKGIHTGWEKKKLEDPLCEAY